VSAAAPARAADARPDLHALHELDPYMAELSIDRPVVEGADTAESLLRPRGWQVELIQLGAGQVRIGGASPFAPVEIIVLNLGPAAVLRGISPRGRIVLAFADQSAPLFRIASRHLTDTTCLVLGSTAPIEIYMPRNSRGCIVSMTSGACGCIDQAPQRGACEFRSLQPEDWSLLARMLDMIDQHGQPSPIRLETAAQPWPDQQPASAMARVLAQSTLLPPDPDENAVRRLAVQRACTYICAHLRARITLADLCDAAGAGARTLEYGFRQFYDVGPMTFLRSIRLSRVRRDLSHVASSGGSVAASARRWHFSHMGQFSRDYRRLFGESPSNTLARARDRLHERQAIRR
jgi:AraC-like DNA-binding protein